MSHYEETYQAWQENPVAFWAKAGEQIDWFSPAVAVFNPDSGVYGRWFDGATCNTCYNCIDRHVEAGYGARTALIYDSPVTGQTASYSFAELQTQVGALASVLRGLGVTKGDRVVIYMPMVAEAIFAMLACARLGAIHSVVFGGFSARELATRIDDATPRVIISASCGIEPGRVIAYKPLLDQAIDLSRNKPANCMILQREALPCDLTPIRDVDYAAAVGAAIANGASTECVPVAATDPLYILYTSGTTGQPKGVVRDNGGHMVALKWSMENHYGVQPGEVFWAASDVGWVVGHSYICYGPLLHGAATVVYEGKPVGTPDAGVFWRVIQNHRVKSFFTAPTAIRAVKREDPQGELVHDYNLRSLQAVFLAGERADPDTITWTEDKLGVPVIDHWWQTETGWAIAANPFGIERMPVKKGSPSVAMPGYRVKVLDEGGREVGPGTLGAIAVELPLPPGTLPGLWNAEERFRKSYLTAFPGHYETGDAGYVDEDGYLY
ncbi:MAG: AMP-binding protein, partial [Maritimibacter sp.]|nr:AMP-binding protein [Maritimibacter sp.]